MAKEKTAAKDQNPEKKGKSSVRGKKSSRVNSTQRYLQFAGAKEDCLLLKNGGLRAVLEVSAVNFHLKSAPEQEGIIRAYQRMLNSVDFPIQILVQSRRLDIDEYVSDLTEKSKKLDNQLLKEQMLDYIDYISQLVNYADIMAKKFYIVVPIDPAYVKPKSTISSFLAYIKPEDTVMNVLQRQREFEDLKKNLESRVNVIMTSIEGIGVKAKRMKTAQIIELFYRTYNPDLSRVNKFSATEELAVED
jgi:hypothetical protein